ncbi:hypothetical protein DVH05_020057 [Phytophthora capsici]|nr:hypothetical protein DVH05_020057 [Phytophthora capsici]
MPHSRDGASYTRELRTRSQQQVGVRQKFKTGLHNMLLEVAQAHRVPSIYRAQQIATAHGHFLLYTPPYHPELQPIELIWARVKNAIARDPATNASELHDKVREQLSAVNSAAWVGVYKHTQKYEDAYLDSMSTIPLVEEDLDAGSSSDDDDGSVEACGAY